MKIRSYLRPNSFTLILRGRKVIMGEVDDLRDGDLKIVGHKDKAYLQVSIVEAHKLRVLGGRWRGKQHALPLEVARRLHSAMMRLAVDDYFIVVSALLKVEALPPDAGADQQR